MKDEKWNHSICVRCWNARWPSRRPYAVLNDKSTCCFCGELHTSGIYIRTGPTNLICDPNKREKGEET